jgi:hypothetical protein
MSDRRGQVVKQAQVVKRAQPNPKPEPVDPARFVDDPAYQDDPERGIFWGPPSAAHGWKPHRCWSRAWHDWRAELLDRKGDG